MPVSQTELGQRLRAAREACRMSQEEVARHLGLSRSTVAQMELGNWAITGLELERLAYLCGRDMRDFFAEEFHEKDAMVALFRAHPDVAGQTDVLDTLRRCLALGHDVSNLECLLGVDRDLGADTHHFRVSLLAALYWLHNLGFVTGAELEQLKAHEDVGRDNDLTAFSGLPEPDYEATWDEFRHRFLSFALEAFRQGAITRAKLQELAQMVNVGPEPLARLLCDIGLGEREEEGDVLVLEA